MLKLNVLISVLLASIFLLTSVSSSQKAFSLLLEICKNDTVVLKVFEVVELEGLTFDKGQGNYSFIVFSAEKKLYETKLDITFEVWKEWIDPETGEMYGELITVDPKEIYIRLPYFTEASRVELYHLNKLIFRHEICRINNVCEEKKGETYENCPQDCHRPSVCGNGICEADETQENCCVDCGCPEGLKCIKNKCVSDRCRNGICEPNYRENYKTCPKDCPSGSQDNYCDGVADGKCDPDCREEEDIDCVKPISPLIYVTIVSIVAILIIVLVIKVRRAI